jgi:hypothetical protein
MWKRKLFVFKDNGVSPGLVYPTFSFQSHTPFETPIEAQLNRSRVAKQKKVNVYFMREMKQSVPKIIPTEGTQGMTR